MTGLAPEREGLHRLPRAAEVAPGREALQRQGAPVESSAKHLLNAAGVLRLDLVLDRDMGRPAAGILRRQKAVKPGRKVQANVLETLALDAQRRPAAEIHQTRNRRARSGRRGVGGDPPVKLAL